MVFCLKYRWNRDPIFCLVTLIYPFRAATLCRSLSDKPEIEKIADVILSTLFLQHKNLFCFQTVQLKTVPLQCPGSGLAKPAPCCRWGLVRQLITPRSGQWASQLEGAGEPRVHRPLLDIPRCLAECPLPVRSHTVGSFCVLLLLCFPHFCVSFC